MVKHGKKYDQAIKLVEPDKFYAPEEAVELIKKVAYANFDETVEVHFKLGIDPRHARGGGRGRRGAVRTRQPVQRITASMKASRGPAPNPAFR